ncbi:MAG: vanadium-dependent haloperoxidase, partial [Singulisphaera sp.]
RAMAIVHAAIFDAVNGIDRQYRPYLVQETARDLNPLYSDASVEAAVAEAAYRTLVALYPRQRVRLDEERANALRRIPDGSPKDHGIAYGGYVADRILDARSGDIPNTPDNYPTDTQDGVGRWQREDDPRALRDLKGRPIESPVTPAWGNVRAFTLTDGQVRSFRAGVLGETRPVPDVTLASFLDSQRYTTAFDEVKRVGRWDAEQRGDRTADQTAIARFWSYDDNLGSTVRLYNQNVRDVVAGRPNTPQQNAPAVALVNLAMADAGIVTWGTKYQPERDYATNNFWRPVAGIRRAGTDDNPLTAPDADWLPLGRRVVPNATPPHPSYTSGHASFGTATFEILRQFYGPDDVAFTLRSEEPGGGGTRSYSSFREAQLENGVSRIYLGVHWGFDSVDGDLEGTGVADYVYRNYLTQLPSGPGATPASVAPILATAGAADSILSPPPSEGGPEFVFAPDTLTDELLLPFARSKKKKKT